MQLASFSERVCHSGTLAFRSGRCKNPFAKMEPGLQLGMTEERYVWSGDYSKSKAANIGTRAQLR